MGRSFPSGQKWNMQQVISFSLASSQAKPKGRFGSYIVRNCQGHKPLLELVECILGLGAPNPWASFLNNSMNKAIYSDIIGKNLLE